MVKATGPDNISARFLKLAGTAIITPTVWQRFLTRAYAKLQCLHPGKELDSGQFIKKGETSERENYRPLSILSIPSMERTVSNAVIDHTTVQHDLLCKHQWAYNGNVNCSFDREMAQCPRPTERDWCGIYRFIKDFSLKGKPNTP